MEEITDVEQAKQIGLKRLDTRSRTCQELHRDLRRHGVSESVANQVVARFVEVGLLNDLLFAQQWVETRRRTKSASRSKLGRELADKGLDESIIAEVLSDLNESEDEIALDLARSKLRSMSWLDSQTIMRRLAAQLERRGFSASVTRRTVMQVIDELGSIADDE